MAWNDRAGITVHDAASGTLIDKFDVSPFALGPDGRWLACQEDGVVVLHAIGSSEPRVVLGRADRVRSFAFSTDGALLAGASFDHTTVLWDVAMREKFSTLRGHREVVNDVAFSPDGKWIATVSGDYTARIWETRTGQVLATLPGSAWIRQVEWSPDGDYLATTTHSKQTVFVFRITGRDHVQQWLTGHGYELTCVAAHPRLDRFATCGVREVITWDVSARRPSPQRIETARVLSSAVAYSPDGSLLATASWSGSANQIDSTIRVRDADTGEIRVQISGPEYNLNALAFDPTGTRLASGGWAGNLVVWDLATGRALRRFVTGSKIWSIAFLDGGLRLATPGKDGILVYNLQSGQVERRSTLQGDVHRFVADPARNRLIVAFHSGAIGSLSLPGLTPGHRLEHTHKGTIESLALSPDGRLLATGGEDHRVVLRDPVSFEPLLSFPDWNGNVRDMAFDSTSRRLAIVGSDSQVELWDVGALSDGLTALGLAWDRPAQATAPTDGPSEGSALPTSEVAIVRPGNINPADYQRADALLQSGIEAFQQRRFADAVADLEQASARFQALRRSSPGDPHVASKHGISLGFLMSSLRDSNRPLEALTRAREALAIYESLNHPTRNDLYNTACVCAGMSALLDHSLPAAREKLEAQAVGLLRRAIENDKRGIVSLMVADRDLDPLRGRSDFRDLMADAVFPRDPFSQGR